MPEPVTLDHVAHAAGVHPSTVSRSLSRPDLVHPDTLARVLAVVDELGYRPNRAARGLSTGRTLTLAVVVADIVNPFFAAVVQAVQDRAQGAGHATLVVDSRGRAAAELDLVSGLTGAVDGVIVCSSTNPPARVRQAAGPLPVVFVNRVVPGAPSVVVDQDAIVALALDHLRSLGHRRVGLVPGPARYWSWRRRRAAAARTPTDLEVVEAGRGTADFDGGIRAARAVADAGVTGVLAFNDLVALGLVRGLTDLGRRVPADCSVVGSDDIPFAAMATPPLTTVAAPCRQLGAAAATLLLEPTAENTRIVVRPDLRVRGSTGPPP